ncbi:MAG: TIGR00153 family protein [Candidatus Electryonea clarkiae]|nr:TIGR00153 family protein [Candidatus Electryonea clarkiae]MDP8288122.1 TIGR00153 family protein [Candidatus Electryonea clarkiae]
MNIMSKLIGGTSPFETLKEHLDKAMECVELVIPLLEAALEGNEEQLEKLSKQAFMLESEADKIKLGLRDNLPKTRMLPVDRIDLLAYLKEQDNIADKVEDLALMLTVRPFKLPEDHCLINFRESLLSLAAESVEAAEEVAEIFTKIVTHKKAAFTGKIASEIRDAASKVGKHERKADEHQFHLIRCILSIEDPSWNFAESYTLLAVVQSLSKLANHAESMSDYLRLMAAD